MNFKKYPRIHRHGKEETEWILEDDVIVEEKIDGMNLSVYTRDWEVRVASRNKEIIKSYKHIVDYIQSHKWLLWLLDRLWEGTRIYWEFLVRHKIEYSSDAYNKFYMFDIEFRDTYLPPKEVNKLWWIFSIDVPKIFFEGKITEEKIISDYVWKTTIWENWEWVVIKQKNFINKFWERAHSKIVSEKFLEKKNKSEWKDENGNPVLEIKIANTYCTFWRVEKIIQKIENSKQRKIDKKDITNIMKIVYHDIITEEVWDMLQTFHHPVIDFKELLRAISRKTKTHLHPYFKFLK